MFRPLLKSLCMSALVCLSACDGKPATEEATVVRIATIAVPGGGKDKLASLGGVVEQQGWLRDALRKKGWTLEWEAIPPAVGGTAINEGLAANTIDFAFYGDLSILIARASGIDVKIVQPGTTLNVYLLVSPGSQARTIADLKGKRIALQRGRAFEPTFLHYLASNGLGLKDFTIVNINPLAATSALASNQVDALVVPDASAWIIVNKKIGRILWSTGQAPKSEKMRVDLVGRGRFLDAHPDISGIVTEGFARSVVWASKETNEKAFVEISAAGGTPIEAVQEDADNRVRPWGKDWSPYVDSSVLERYRYVSAYAAENGLISKPIDLARLFDRRFSEAALKSIGLADPAEAPVKP